MKDEIRISTDHVSRLLSSRKMGLQDLGELAAPTNGGYLLVNGSEGLKQLASAIDLPPAMLLEGETSFPFDLDDKIKISRKESQFERIGEKDGQPMYHYRHVMKTTADPHLMALRTSPLCDDESKLNLNSGHLAKELVYVLKGVVDMHWQNKKGQRRKARLNQGDSVYLEPWVPHAFTPAKAGAEILAVDFH